MKSCRRAANLVYSRNKTDINVNVKLTDEHYVICKWSENFAKLTNACKKVAK